MNVLSGGGLVGYISDIAKGHAVVTSIINDNVNVSAMQSTTGDACVVTGDLPYMKEHGLLKLQYMDTDFNISREQCNCYIPIFQTAIFQDLLLAMRRMLTGG